MYPIRAPKTRTLQKRIQKMPDLQCIHQVGWRILSMLRHAPAYQGTRVWPQGISCQTGDVGRGGAILNYCKDKCSEWAARVCRYSEGIKRCTPCEKFIRWEGNNCPCCGTKLKSRAYPTEVRTREKRKKARLEECGITKSCKICGVSFTSTNTRRVTCGGECSITWLYSKERKGKRY